jgi:hypothetical protein
MKITTLNGRPRFTRRSARARTAPGRRPSPIEAAPAPRVWSLLLPLGYSRRR